MKKLILLSLLLVASVATAQFRSTISRIGNATTALDSTYCGGDFSKDVYVFNIGAADTLYAAMENDTTRAGSVAGSGIPILEGYLFGYCFHNTNGRWVRTWTSSGTIKRLIIVDAPGPARVKQ